MDAPVTMPVPFAMASQNKAEHRMPPTSNGGGGWQAEQDHAHYIARRVLERRHGDDGHGRAWGARHSSSCNCENGGGEKQVIVYRHNEATDRFVLARQGKTPWLARHLRVHKGHGGDGPRQHARRDTSGDDKAKHHRRHLERANPRLDRRNQVCIDTCGVLSVSYMSTKVFEIGSPAHLILVTLIYGRLPPLVLAN